MCVGGGGDPSCYFTNPVISHESEKNQVLLMTSGTYPWSFVTQIFRNI